MPIKRKFARSLPFGAMLFASACASAQPSVPFSASNRAAPRIETRAAPGYRLYRAGYRLKGGGALVTAQLCRLPGWAAQGPGRLEVLRLDPAGTVAERQVSYLPRLGLRSGNNCTGVAAHFDHAPGYGETVRICALSGGGKCG